MNDTVTETLTKGVEMHLAGEFGFANQLYGSVLKLEPNHADANHNIGLLKLSNSNLFLEDDKLIFNADLIFEINNSDRLYSLLNTAKKSNYRSSHDDGRVVAV